ncbi:MAG: flagellar basal-body rod protein FlgB [Clostridiales bacterium]|jgi:flagellar basal-body rod protein FlgB|nr:flagellar basal-body rod protein FlgB [Oscillospiraceae bacterium]MDN5377861.1 flagellar basal-body rod protein FlgB [Clostridiales bacterium]
MALFENTSFKLLQKGLDAAWYKQQVTLQNIANDSTPYYKAKSVEFSAVLKEKFKGKKVSLSNASYSDDIENPIDLKVTTTVERGTNQTLDENNVDMEKEQVELADTQYLYSTLIDKINGEFSMIKSAIQR